MNGCTLKSRAERRSLTQEPDTQFSHILSFLLSLIQDGHLSATGESMCIVVLVNRLGGLNLSRKKSLVRLIDRPDITAAVYRGRKTTT